MFYTPLFRDPKAKAGAVTSNVLSLIAVGISTTIKERIEREKGKAMTVSDHFAIQTLTLDFINNHPATVSWAEISDFMSTAVTDFFENRKDLSDD